MVRLTVARPGHVRTWLAATREGPPATGAAETAGPAATFPRWEPHDASVFSQSVAWEEDAPPHVGAPPGLPAAPSRVAHARSSAR